MKTNHRDGSTKGKPQPQRPYKGKTKADARQGRRVAERKTIDAVRQGEDPEGLVTPSKNQEVSDFWKHD